jgi:glucose/arabinose dehydrogenase
MLRRARAIALALPVALSACGAGAPASGDSAAHGAAHASASASAVRLVKVGGFHQPVYVTGAPGDPHRVFVVQRTGQVMLMLNGHRQARPFLDVGKSVNSGGEEQGLLGLAFPANYARSGLFYVDYTIAGDNIKVVQYKRSFNANIANPASARVVLTIDHPNYTNHNGGQLAFGPDGDLYIGVGRRRQRERSPQQRAEHRHAAREDPANKPLTGWRLRDPVHQPVPRKARQAR